jgi:hypothetical protein
MDYSHIIERDSQEYKKYGRKREQSQRGKKESCFYTPFLKTDHEDGSGRKQCKQGEKR